MVLLLNLASFCSCKAVSVPKIYADSMPGRARKPAYVPTGRDGKVELAIAGASGSLLRSIKSLRVGLYVRFHPILDNAYFPAWLMHYRNIGFDGVVVLVDEIHSKRAQFIRKQFAWFVKIVLVKDSKNNHPNRHPDANLRIDAYQNHVLNGGYAWVFLVDTNEYLLLAPQFESIQAYIRAKEAKHGVLDAIKFRWAMSDQLMPGCQEVLLPNFFAGSVASKAVFQTP